VVPLEVLRSCGGDRHISSTGHVIDTVTVVRNGRLVMDAVFCQFHANRAHIIHRRNIPQRVPMRLRRGA
jgi:hypothetical protein